MRSVSSVSRWRDSGHLERAMATAGGQEAFDAAGAAILDDARSWRFAEMPKRREDDPGAGHRSQGGRVAGT